MTIVDVIRIDELLIIDRITIHFGKILRVEVILQGSEVMCITEKNCWKRGH